VKVQVERNCLVLCDKRLARIPPHHYSTHRFAGFAGQIRYEPGWRL
jgi:hypothetical protein